MTDTDALDAGFLAVADGLMVRHVDEFWCDPGHRQAPPNRLMRDEILAALRSERVRGEESMRERAAYQCPVCKHSDPTAYQRCNHPACPDGRDPRTTETTHG